MPGFPRVNLLTGPVSIRTIINPQLLTISLHQIVILLAVFIISPLIAAPDSTLAGIYEKRERPSQHWAYVLETGDDALLARVHLIRHAQSTINIQTFIWSNDDSGRFVFYELLNAAQRGVQIRILIDDLSLRQSSDYVAYIASAHPNIHIKQYNPLVENINANILQVMGSFTFQFGQSNQRMHNKTVIVDGKYGITGGRNFADDYFDRGTHRSFIDRDLLITGPVVSDMNQSFEEFWNFKLSISSRDMKDVKRLLESGEFKVPEDVLSYSVPLTFHGLQSCSIEPACMQQRIFDKGYNIDEVSFVSDSPDKIREGDDRAKTTNSLAELMNNAERSILMQTPYLVVGGNAKKLLKEMREKKPDLEFIISTNSLAAADHFYAYAFSYKNKRDYLKDLKWRIFELKPEPADIKQLVPDIEGHVRAPDHYTCIHAKTFVFDEETVWLGSFNFDPRSATLNTEAGLVIRDRKLAAGLAKTIRAETAPGNSWAIGADKKLPVWAQLSGVAEEVSSWVSFLNVWPFTYTSSFELKPGATEVPYYDDDFYENYSDVGQFPEANASTKALKTRLTKAFFGPIEPII